MTGTQGNPLLVGHRGEVECVGVRQDEAHHCGAAFVWPEQPDAVDLGQLLAGSLRQALVMLEDGLPPDAVEVVDGSA